MQQFTATMNLALELAAMSAQLTKRVDSPLSFHGISFTEFLVMHHLSLANQQCMRRVDLANKIGLSASGITRLISPMEKIGLIQKQKNPRDARVSLVKLSESGERIFNEARVTFEQSCDSVFENLSDDEIQQLRKLAVKLV
jgi:DNA-binding MarR family transcriptional regulator